MGPSSKEMSQCTQPHAHARHDGGLVANLAVAAANNTNPVLRSPSASLLGQQLHDHESRWLGHHMGGTSRLSSASSSGASALTDKGSLQPVASPVVLGSRGDPLDCVRVRVGDGVFLTSATTLTRRDHGSLFGTELRACRAKKLREGAANQDEMEMCFDRDPRLFLVVLNYLRTGKLDAEVVKRHSSRELKGLLREAQFYRCHGLVGQVEKLMKPRKAPLVKADDGKEGGEDEGRGQGHRAPRLDDSHHHDITPEEDDGLMFDMAL